MRYKLVINFGLPGYQRHHSQWRIYTREQRGKLPYLHFSKSTTATFCIFNPFINQGIKQMSNGI